MAAKQYLYSSDPGLLIGFHGCEKSLVDDVVNHRTILRPSKNKWDWLGDGIYFWQNNYERALAYATNPPETVTIKEPAVLGAVFSLGNCLDLTDSKWIDLVKYSYETYEHSAKASGKQLPSNKNTKDDNEANDRAIRLLDCAVIMNLHNQVTELGEAPFESVRGVFFEGKELYPGAGFYQKTHIQISIRNPNLIRGFFIPREATDWP